MIRFEHGMLVLDNTATKDDVNAVNEFAEFVCNEEQERIIKLLENAFISDGESLASAKLYDLIALIKGENR